MSRRKKSSEIQNQIKDNPNNFLFNHQVSNNEIQSVIIIFPTHLMSTEKQAAYRTHHKHSVVK